MRVWTFALLLIVATGVRAQAPVEDRRPARDDTAASQRRVEFTRQALDRAEAEVRDASAAHSEAQTRFDDAKAQLEKSAANLARAKAAAAEARKNHEGESSRLERQRTGKGG
jgi:hypothetical protein